MFLRVLKSSMVELINRDFADFLNLSTNLVRGVRSTSEELNVFIQVGFDKSITTLKNPLTAMKTDILVSEEDRKERRNISSSRKSIKS